MRRIRQFHLYLGCIFAPLLTFFAISGAWQTFMLHRSTKDGRYNAPRILDQLSGVHLRQEFAAPTTAPSGPFRWFVLAMAIGIVLSATLGVIMAFKLTRQRRIVWLCLIAGFTLPLLLLNMGGGTR